MNTTNELTFNILPFNHTQERIEAALFDHLTDRCFRLSERDCNLLAPLAGFPTETKEIYVCTDNMEREGAKKISLAVSPAFCTDGERCWSLSFLKKYYTHTLSEHFRAKGIPVRTNFVSNTDVWIKCPSPYPDCTGYRVFTLRIQFAAPEYTPELVVIMDTVHSVHNKPLSDTTFSELTTDVFGKVLYGNAIYPYKYLPDAARREMEKVFPVISYDLGCELGFKKPAPDKGNRYLKYLTAVENFRSDYLTDDGIAQFMKLQPDWKKITPERLPNDNKEVQFGTGTETNPFAGIISYGPKTLIDDNVVFFFILHETDKALAATINDYLKGNKYTFKGGLSSFLKMKYTTEPALSIIFKDKNNPIPEITKELESKRIVSDESKRYVALYLSPHSKNTYNKQQKSIYYRLKEELLQRGIVTQTIDANKTWGGNRLTEKQGKLEKAVLETKFHYSLPNILVAIHAKLGGTPWSLGEQTSDELVIGISAYQSRELEKKYLGSTFSFTNEGKFQGFNCFESTKTTVLAGSIALAVKKYCSENDNLQRLVIHFYKRLNWRELKPIEKALSGLGLSVPVVVVSVNKTFSDDLVGFDMARTQRMPLSGTYVALPYSQYLLYNNQSATGDETINEREGYPFPLKITIQQFLPVESENTELLSGEAAPLLQQVCHFSQLYWKSVSRQWMPVTLRYPEMLAQIAPHFRHKDWGELGSDSLWFL